MLFDVSIKPTYKLFLRSIPVQEIKSNGKFARNNSRYANDCYMRTIVTYLLEMLRGTTQISHKHSHALGHGELNREKINSCGG